MLCDELRKKAKSYDSKTNPSVNKWKEFFIEKAKQAAENGYTRIEVTDLIPWSGPERGAFIDALDLLCTEGGLTLRSPYYGKAYAKNGEHYGYILSWD